MTLWCVSGMSLTQGGFWQHWQLNTKIPYELAPNLHMQVKMVKYIVEQKYNDK